MDKKSTILVVDDDEDFRKILGTFLKQDGYIVIEAEDAATGKRLVAEKNPDLILLDVMMEEVDSGFTFAEELGDSIPIIIISSIADSSVKVFDADELPVKDIIQKPVKREVLAEKVRRALA